MREPDKEYLISNKNITDFEVMECLDEKLVKGSMSY